MRPTQVRPNPNANSSLRRQYAPSQSIIKQKPIKTASRPSTANTTIDYFRLRDELMDTHDFENVSLQNLLIIKNSVADTIQDCFANHEYVKAKQFQEFNDELEKEIAKQGTMLDDYRHKINVLRSYENTTQKRKKIHPLLRKFDKETSQLEDNMAARHQQTLSQFEDLWQNRMAQQYAKPSSQLRELRAEEKQQTLNGQTSQSKQTREQIAELEQKESFENEENYYHDYAKSKQRILNKFKVELENFRFQREKQRILLKNRVKGMYTGPFEPEPTPRSITMNRPNKYAGLQSIALQQKTKVLPNLYKQSSIATQRVYSGNKKQVKLSIGTMQSIDNEIPESIIIDGNDICINGSEQSYSSRKKKERKVISGKKKINKNTESDVNKTENEHTEIQIGDSSDIDKKKPQDKIEANNTFHSSENDDDHTKKDDDNNEAASSSEQEDDHQSENSKQDNKPLSDHQKDVNSSDNEKVVNSSDHQKDVNSSDNEKVVNSSDNEKVVNSSDNEKVVHSSDNEKVVHSSDNEKVVHSSDNEKDVNSSDHQKDVNSSDNEKDVHSSDHQKVEDSSENEKVENSLSKDKNENDDDSKPNEDSELSDNFESDDNQKAQSQGKLMDIFNRVDAVINATNNDDEIKSKDTNSDDKLNQNNSDSINLDDILPQKKPMVEIEENENNQNSDDVVPSNKSINLNQSTSEKADNQSDHSSEYENDVLIHDYDADVKNLDPQIKSLNDSNNQMSSENDVLIHDYDADNKNTESKDLPVEENNNDSLTDDENLSELFEKEYQSSSENDDSHQELPSNNVLSKGINDIIGIMTGNDPKDDDIQNDKENQDLNDKQSSSEKIDQDNSSDEIDTKSSSKSSSSSSSDEVVDKEVDHSSGSIQPPTATNNNVINDVLQNFQQQPKQETEKSESSEPINDSKSSENENNELKSSSGSFASSSTSSSESAQKSSSSNDKPKNQNVLESLFGIKKEETEKSADVNENRHESSSDSSDSEDKSNTPNLISNILGGVAHDTTTQNQPNEDSSKQKEGTNTTDNQQSNVLSIMDKLFDKNETNDSSSVDFETDSSS